MSKKLVNLLLLFLAVSVLTAGEQGYEELRSSMLSGNADLRKADEQVAQSALDVKDAKASYQPTISLMAGAAYLANPPGVDIDMSDLSYALYAMSSGTVSVPGTMSMELENTYYMAGLSITEPIITWGKRPKAVELYKNLADISALSKMDLQDQLTVELKTSLTALKYMDELLVLLDETEQVAADLVQVSEDGYADGMLIKQDVTEARVEALEVKVKKQEVLQLYSDLLQSVRTITAQPELESSDILFTPDENEIVYLASLDRDWLRAAAIDPEAAALRMLNKQTAAYQAKESVAKAGMYMIPDLALSVSANVGGPKFPGQKNWTDEDDWGLAITVGLSTTIWDGGKKLNELKRSKSQVAGAIADYDQAVSQLSELAESSISKMDLALAKLEWLEVKLEAEEGRLELLELKQELGAAAKTDVLSQKLDVLGYEMEMIEQKISLAEAAYTISYLARV